MLPVLWIGAAAIGAVVTAIGAAVALSDDDNNSRDNRAKIEAQRQREIEAHNNKIYKTISSYKEREVQSLEKEYGIKLHDMHQAESLALSEVPFTNTANKLVFNGIDISDIKKENHKISKEIKQLKELKDALKYD